MNYGIIHNYFSKEDLEDFPKHAYIERLSATFHLPLELQTWHYCTSSVPVGPHTELHYNGVENYMQFLVPDSVNYDPTLCGLTSTVIEGQDLKWERGSLLWWHSKCKHWSGRQNRSRQCWVIQTRVS